MTRTYAILEVSPAAYDEIQAKLTKAGYQHAFHTNHEGDVIDMHGIALRRAEASLEDRRRVVQGLREGGYLREGCYGQSATAALARIEAEDHPVRVMDLALEEDRRRQDDADLRYQQQQDQ